MGRLGRWRREGAGALGPASSGPPRVVRIGREERRVAGLFALRLAGALLLWPLQAAQADEALDRCRKVQLGMTAAEASAVLGQPVRLGFNTFPRFSLPCIVKITPKNRVWEIQVDERFPDTVLDKGFFEKILADRIKRWGKPNWSNTTADRTGWAQWGQQTPIMRDLTVVQESDDIVVNDGVIDYNIVKEGMKR